LNESHIVNPLTITYMYRNIEIITNHELCQFKNSPKTGDIYLHHEEWRLWW